MYLAGGIVLDVVDHPDGESAMGQLEMLVGLLQQAQSSHAGSQARNVEVSLRLLTQGKRITFKSRHMRAVADSSLIARLEQVLGKGHVRIIPGKQRHTTERRGHRGRKTPAQQDDAMESIAN